MALGRRLSSLRSRIRETLKEAEQGAILRVAPEAKLAPQGEEPPVVARLMVEIRSDGTRTIARGAIEEVAGGERVAIQAEGATAAHLAASLAKALFATPFLAGATVRAVLEGRRAERKAKRGS